MANQSTRNALVGRKKLLWVDRIKWLFVFILLAASIFANAHFSAVAVGVRAAVGIVLCAIMLGVLVTTSSGEQLWAFTKLSRNELRKVVWPTKQETIQMTMLVTVLIVVISMILWGLDSLFFHLVKLVIV